MNKITHFLLVAILLMMVACTSSKTLVLSPSFEVTIADLEVLSLLNVDTQSECSQTFRNNSIWLVEAYCQPEKAQIGIYLSDSAGVRYFNWFDKEFSQWQQEEGCEHIESCFYEATVDSTGRVVLLTYHFKTNLSQGFYKLDSGSDTLIILDKKITDSPS